MGAAYSSYAARLNDTVTEPVFAYIGGQSLSEDDLKPFTEWMEGVLASGRSKPDVVNRATFTEKLEFRTRYLLCWRAPVDYADWAKQKAVSSGGKARIG